MNPPSTPSAALIVVDVQIDFCEGGVLGAPGGTAVARAVSEHVRTGRYRHVVATRDYHIDPGEHFSEEPDFATSWPPHCRAGTPGAAFHPELDVAGIDAVFSKGQYADGYSGFEGTHEGTDAPLADWLRARGIDTVHVTGIALDYCVRATALDALRAGFAVTVPLGLTAGIAQSTVDTAVAELTAAGANLTGALPPPPD